MKKFDKECLKKKKVYISGSITGNKYYKRNFARGERLMAKLGAVPVNPAKWDSKEEQVWAWWMKRDIKLLVDCDFVFALDGWEQSKGAKLEVYIAKKLGIKVIKEADL